MEHFRRRKTDKPLTSQQLEDGYNHHRRLSDTEAEAMEKLIASVDELKREVALNTQLTEKLSTGFVGGDMESHRRYHEEIIARMALKRKLGEAVLVHLLKAGTLSALGGALWVLWLYFKVQVKA